MTDFEKLVFKMRKAQKEYQDLKDDAHYKAMQDMERKVDTYLAALIKHMD